VFPNALQNLYVGEIRRKQTQRNDRDLNIVVNIWGHERNPKRSQGDENHPETRHREKNAPGGHDFVVAQVEKQGKTPFHGHSRHRDHRSACSYISQRLEQNPGGAVHIEASRNLADLVNNKERLRQQTNR